jgi:putative salt-induced outer membrane protein YdiY
MPGIRDIQLLLILAGSLFPQAWAQNPSQVPPKIWSGSAGVGFSLTTGNSETSNLNFAFKVLRDPKTRNVFRADAFYLRGKENDLLSRDRLRFNVRDDYTLTDGLFLFGGGGYLRDPFKEIEYLINPIAGLGYEAYDTERVSLKFGGGGGFVWEKAPDSVVDTDGSLNAGQELEFQISEVARITQSLSGIWKMRDLGNALYHFDVGLTATIIGAMEFKIEFQDDYKTMPADPETRRNDTATVLSLVYNF